jgi:hypothetical protein
MFVGSPTRDLFDYAVSMTGFVAQIVVLVVVTVWAYRSRERR